MHSCAHRSLLFPRGVLGLFTGLIAGTMFGVGARVMDIASTSSHPDASKYVPYVFSVSFSAVVLTVAAFGMADALAKLG